MPPPVTVIIPAFNEESCIASVVRSVQENLARADIQAEVLVVDDGSRDATAENAERAGATVVRHVSNRGYGAALKTGLAAARYDLSAITDADGTYPVERLPDLLAAMERADMAIGARVGENVHIPLVRRPAKWFLMHLANYVSRAKIQDLNSGMRVFWRDAANQYLNILPDQFSFTSTITIAMHCDRYAIHYEPIDYHRRTGRSKIVPWDAATFFMLIVRIAMLFRPLRVFFPVVLTFVGYGILKGTWDYIQNQFISQTAILAMVAALQFLLMGLIADAVATRLHRTGAETYKGIRQEALQRRPARDASSSPPSPVTQEGPR